MALAGGRPTSPPVPGEPEELGGCSRRPSPRRAPRQGRALHAGRAGRWLVGRAVRPRARRRSATPPAGRCARCWRRARSSTSAARSGSRSSTGCWGADVDPLAVATTEAALTLWAGGTPPAAGHLVVADTLLDGLGRGRRSTSSSATRRSSASWLRPRRARRRGRGPPARAVRRRGRAYTDTAALFLVAACELAAPGGTVAHGAAAVGARRPRRGRGAGRGRRSAAGWSTCGSRPRLAFDAAVEVCVPVIEVGGPRPAARLERAPRRGPRRARRSSCRVGRRSGTRPRRRRVPQRVLRHGRPRARERRLPTGPARHERPRSTSGAARGASGPPGSGGGVGPAGGRRRRRCEGRAADWVAAHRAGRSWWWPRRPGSSRSSVDDDGVVDPRRAARRACWRPPSGCGRSGRRARPPRRSRAWAAPARGRHRAVAARPQGDGGAAARPPRCPIDDAAWDARHDGVPGRRPRRLRRRRWPRAYGRGPEVAAWWVERARIGLESARGRAR